MGFYIYPTAHNKLLHTGRWGYVHRPETKMARGEFTTSEAKPQVVGAQTYAARSPRPLAEGSEHEHLAEFRAWEQGRVPAPGDLRKPSKIKMPRFWATPST